MKPFASILFAALLLAGRAAFAGMDAVEPQDAATGASCAAEIARYRALLDSDVSTGNLEQKVYNQTKGEIAGAERECSAGHDAKARAMVLASRRRHGYPAGL